MITHLRKNYPKWLTNSPQVVKSGMSSPVSYDLQGQGGGIVIVAADGTVAGNFRWIQVINDAEIDSVVSSNIAGVGSLGSVIVPAGVGIGGRFSNITLTSGVVIAYYA